MQGQWASFGIGFVTGLRSMTACAALTWAASQEKTQLRWLPSGPVSRGLAATAALGEMAGDKMPFAPDRRIVPSVAARLAIGAVGGAALVERNASPLTGPLLGMAGAVAGTLLGRTLRGGTTRSGSDWTRALTEDAVAAGLAATLVYYAEPRGRASRQLAASPARRGPNQDVAIADRHDADELLTALPKHRAGR